MGLLIWRFDQVISQLNQGIVPTKTQGVAVNGIAGQVAGVGLIVPDAQVGFGHQAGDQGF